MPGGCSVHVGAARPPHAGVGAGQVARLAVLVVGAVGVATALGLW